MSWAKDSRSRVASGMPPSASQSSNAVVAAARVLTATSRGTSAAGEVPVRCGDVLGHHPVDVGVAQLRVGQQCRLGEDQLHPLAQQGQLGRRRSR